MNRKMIANELLKVAKLLLSEATFDTLDDASAYTSEVSRMIRKKKKELGITNFRQSYKGTGSQKAVRQIWVKFANGAVIDIWIHPGFVEYGGVVSILPSGKRFAPNPRKRKIDINNAKRAADEVAEDLKKWMED